MANANATTGGNAQAQADNHSTASSSATTGGVSGSFATNFSTADTRADSGSTAQAESDQSSKATSTASGSSLAQTQATNGSSAQGEASRGSSVQASAGNGGSAQADAFNNSTATALNSASNTFVGAYAVNGSTASGSDSSPPVCEPGPRKGIAVVVSPAGNCGPVDRSPFAADGATPEIDPTMAGAGLTIVGLGLLLLAERRRARS